MEQYKEKLKVTQWITAIAALVLTAFSILFLLSECGIVNITPVAGDSHWQSRWRGFISGASCGIAILMLVSLFRTAKALRSDAELKKLYIQDHDERQIKIWTSARALSMQIFLIAGLVAGVVAGYFNMTVSITIFVCVLVHSLMGMACKIYYSHKF